ncbi:MAG TPA: class I SAM-dependent methyltransferase [Phycisphaerales bacterium]|nr:class I SAM-dependent methyltransferase [Phycisphaerales bacterium]
MHRLRAASGRAIQRVRNSVWEVVHGGRASGGGADAADTRPSRLAHYPSSDPATHRPCYALPAWMDRAVPWIASLERLYAMPASWPGSLSPEAGLLLYALVRNAAPRVVVETGTFMSVSTHWIAAALRDAGPGRRLHCFDRFDTLAWAHAEALSAAGVPDDLAFVRDALRRAALDDLVTLYRGDSAREIARAATHLAENGVQLAFIDGDHTLAGVTRDFHAVEPFLDTGGSVILHDVFPDQCGHDGPRRFLDALAAADPRYTACDLYTSPYNYGMAVLRRIR